MRVTDALNGTARAGSSVSVVAEDPDLAAAVPDDERDLAARASRAAVVELQFGPCADLPTQRPGNLGAILLGAFVLVCTEVGGRAHVELLGPGDVISPWVQLASEFELPMPTALSAHVVVPGRLALLDRRFALRTARWPGIHGAIVHRLLMRVRWLGVQAAINSVSQIDSRVECTLWHLAHRFGRVTTQGVVLQVPLTHAQLAQMIGAQRPSTTVALGRLKTRGLISPLPGRRWLLHGEAPTQLTSRPRAGSAAPSPFAPTSAPSGTPLIRVIQQAL